MTRCPCGGVCGGNTERCASNVAAAIRIGKRAQAESERLRAVLERAKAPRCCGQRACHRPGDFDVDAHNAEIAAALSPSPANEQADKEQG